jgi:hypothetical protein
VARRSAVPPRWLVWSVFFGAMAPDVDVLGNLFGPGVYFSRAWYGHRMASHSVLGTLALALLGAWLLLPWLRRARGACAGTRASWQGYAWLVGAWWLGGLLHIVGDLFTPGLPMPVLWPLQEPFGALRHIGWFSPYLLWLFLATFVLDAALAHLGRLRDGRWRPQLAFAAWALYAVAAARWLQFLFTSRYDSGSQWLAYHQRLLPDALIVPVSGAVHSLWHLMTR